MTAAGGGSVLHPVGAPAGVAVSGCGGFPADRVRGQPRGGQGVPHITGSDCSRLSYSSQNKNSQVKPTFSSSFYFRRWDDFCCISITSTVEKNCLKTIFKIVFFFDNLQNHLTLNITELSYFRSTLLLYSTLLKAIIPLLLRNKTNITL